MQNKLKHLMSQWPTGGVNLASELDSRGYSPQLLQSYKKSGWIWPIGDGAYSKNGDKPSLYGALSALNRQASLPVHFGGRVALSLQGISHHLNFGVQTFDLFHPSGLWIPKWFKKYNWGERTKLRFFQPKLFGDDFRLGVTESELFGHRCLISSKERAILEFIYLMKTNEEFLEAEQFVGSLTILDSNLLQNLLLACKSFKTKRVFLYLAEKENWDWFKKLNLKRVDLGKGPRSIVEKGEYNSKYGITIPRTWLKGANV